jgi:hypothetical protein
MPDRLALTDVPVRKLFERIAGPAAASSPDLIAIGAALVELAMDVDYLASWVARLGDQNGAWPIHTPERGLEPGDGGRVLASQTMPDA